MSGGGVCSVCIFPGAESVGVYLRRRHSGGGRVLVLFHSRGPQCAVIVGRSNVGRTDRLYLPFNVSTGSSSNLLLPVPPLGAAINSVSRCCASFDGEKGWRGHTIRSNSPSRYLIDITGTSSWLATHSPCCLSSLPPPRPRSRECLSSVLSTLNTQLGSSKTMPTIAEPFTLATGDTGAHIWTSIGL
ncbi:hypothetical protein BDN71DRAFT_210379 [Pleurotus eryngii]|uniref:Uncharacterized protein n=1 Tax=Pleurotus eryngii TaxID=5323 RepID=A0A9P6DC02_PLEER|nr:hypothetical protein BDN71DRAFT_210379 [Pleurotus eryngii]